MISLGSFYNGQSSLGRLEKNKFVTLDNCDIHGEPGFVSSNYAMESESTTPNEPCFRAVVPSLDVYWVSKTSGKIWKKTLAGAFSLVTTNTNGAHRGARYFNGYLWYWTATKLGHFNMVSTWTDSFATFTNGDARGSAEHANQLLIADGRYCARVDATNTFSANEFVVPSAYSITCIASLGDDVLFGTRGIETCKVFLWNSVATSWTVEDEVMEVSINEFLKLDNVWLAQVGTEGNFYYWTGSKMAYFGKIRGITTSYINGDQMSATYKRRLIWSNGTKIYSIHKEDNTFQFAFCGEYTATGTIASIVTQNGALLASVGTGIDKVGATKATATIETYEYEGVAKEVSVKYDVSPEGVGIQTKIDGGSYVSQTPVTDTRLKRVSFNGGMLAGTTLQVKVTLSGSAKIKFIEIV